MNLIYRVVTRLQAEFPTCDRKVVTEKLEYCTKLYNVDFEGLLNSKPCDFFNDIFGISREINMDTGRLDNFGDFLPKYAKKKGVNMKKTYTVQLTKPCYPSKGYEIDVLNGDYTKGDKRDYLSSDLINCFVIKAENKKQAINGVFYQLYKLSNGKAGAFIH